MSLRWRVVCVFAMASLALATTRCTLIGAGVGAAVRSPAKEAKPLSVWEVSAIRPGTRLDLLLANGQLLTGSFEGGAWLPRDDYLRDYELARAALAGRVALPELGADAFLLLLDGTSSHRELLGFGRSFVLVSALKGERPERIRFRDVSLVADVENHGVSGPALEDLVSAGKLPSIEMIRIGVEQIDGTAAPRDAAREQLIRVDDVRQASVYGTRGHVQTGALVGAVIDSAVVIAVLASSTSSSPSSSTQSSCPYIYSFDGSAYALDAEPFAGAILEVAQWPDWSRLDRLRESRGAYRLRLSNELQEVDYLDEIRLFVVDHPPGTEVVPDGRGGLLGVRRARVPGKARDLRGVALSELLSRADGREWLSDPFWPRPQGLDDLRDGVEAEFDRAAEARQATLVIRGRSTPWASELLHRVLSLQGRDFRAWYARANSDLLVQMSLYRFSQEAVPTLRLWTGTQWRPVGQLYALPTATSAVQGFRFDLAGLPEGPVRLRIDGVPGTWQLDELSMDYGSQPATRTTELEPTSARGVDGREVRDVLRRSDGDRHVLRTGQRLDVVFAAPPRTAGLQRSFVLKTAGYYDLLLVPGGDAQTAMFERLLVAPGALASYSLQLAQEEKRVVLGQLH